MKQINDKVIEEMAIKEYPAPLNAGYGSQTAKRNAYKAGIKAALSLLSDEEVYVEVDLKEKEFLNKGESYFVEVKEVYKGLWVNAFTLWLRKVKAGELLNGK